MDQSYSWRYRRSVLNEIAEIAIGVTLLLLVMGLWVHLWVPQLPIP